MERALLLFGVLLGPAGCDCGSTSELQSSAGTEPASDAEPARHPLSGSWSGSARVPGQGVVAAVLSVDQRGRGTAVLSVRGVTVTEPFRIEGWNGTVLQVSHRGTVYSANAEIDGSVLYADLPIIGWVRLVRKTAAADELAQE